LLEHGCDRVDPLRNQLPVRPGIPPLPSWRRRQRSSIRSIIRARLVCPDRCFVPFAVVVPTLERAARCWRFRFAARESGEQDEGGCLHRLRSAGGADSVIDYTKQNSAGPDVSFDFILDAVGRMKTSKFKQACRTALSPAGRYVSIDDGALKLDSGRLAVITDLVEAGHVEPVIDRCHPLEKIVEAHSYVGEGHKKGGVAITI